MAFSHRCAQCKLVFSTPPYMREVLSTKKGVYILVFHSRECFEGWERDFTQLQEVRK